MRQLLFFFLVLVPLASSAQHNEFRSLYMYDALPLNPAYAGNKGALVVNLNYRDQWSGMAGAPKTFAFTTHLLTRSKKTGLGFSAVNDRFGIQTNLKLNAVYAYHIRMKGSEITLGVAGGIRNRSIDVSALVLQTATDETFLLQSRQRLQPDATFGALFKNDWLLTGFSVFNLAQLGDAATPPAGNLYFSALLKAGKDLRLKPTVLIKYTPRSPLTCEGNLTAFYRQSLSFGAGMRSDLSGNGHVRFQLNRQLAVAYLYERNFGAVNLYLKHTHEFMLNYTFDYQPNVQSSRYL